jgi:hypothetical protein
MTDDDDIWLGALAGRAVSDEHSPAACEARHLREALLRHRRKQFADAPMRDARREQALLARAQREGLIPPPRRPTIWAHAAALAFLAFALAWFLRPVEEAERARSVDGDTVTLEAADPVALKKQLLDELHAAGVPATGYERFGTEGIDADLPQPVPEEVRAILQKHGIEVPEDGVLKIEIAPRDTP